MKRDLKTLQNRHFDVLIVGGGVHGACVARDAALRGFSVALIEQSDFCSATSHNSLKTVHGGIRYLQHLNFKRAFESIREQQIFLRTAPHLVQPLKFLMPTYGWGMRGPLAMAAGIVLFESLYLLTSLCRFQKPRFPRARLLSVSRCLKLAPGIAKQELTGGAIWCDAQVSLADKAVLQMLQQAEDNNALIVNYVKAEELLCNDEADQVTGVLARDVLTDQEFVIKASLTINAAGPWVHSWTANRAKAAESLQVKLVKSMNLVTSLPAPPVAIGIKSRRSSDSKIDQAERLFFVVPWQGKAVIGTSHFTHNSTSLALGINPQEIEAFVEEFSAAHPTLKLSVDDVLYCYQGLTPGDDSVDTDGAKLHHSKIVDHAENNGMQGLLSIIGIKWTTARRVAELTVNRAALKLGQSTPGCTHRTNIPDYQFTKHETRELSEHGLREFTLMHIEHTQAQRLVDIVLRRTNDLVLGTMDMTRLRIILETMSHHFTWSDERITHELKLLMDTGLSPQLVEQIRNEFSGIKQ